MKSPNTTVAGVVVIAAVATKWVLRFWQGAVTLNPDEIAGDVAAVSAGAGLIKAKDQTK